MTKKQFQSKRFTPGTVVVCLDGNVRCIGVVTKFDTNYAHAREVATVFVPESGSEIQCAASEIVGLRGHIREVMSTFDNKHPL